jgi:phage-related tail protein
MADIEHITTVIESTVSKKEQLQKAIDELDAHRDGIQNCTIQWKDLEHHFSCIHEALKKRVNELIEKEKSFEAKALETREMLEKRDEAVAVKEQASLARVQEQKDAALDVIIEARSKQIEVSVDASAKTSEMPKIR